jgi:hypothetical protein
MRSMPRPRPLADPTRRSLTDDESAMMQTTKMPHGPGSYWVQEAQYGQLVGADAAEKRGVSRHAWLHSRDEEEASHKGL